MFRRKFNSQILLLVGLLSSMALFTYLLSTGGIYYYDADFNLHIGMHLDAILDRQGSRGHPRATKKKLVLDEKVYDRYRALNKSMYRYSVPRDYSCFFKDKLQGPDMPDVHSAFADPIAGYVAFIGLKFLKQKWHSEVFACEFPDGKLTKSNPIIDDSRSFGIMPQYVVVITCPLPDRYRWRAYFNMTLRRLSIDAAYSNITVCTSGVSPETQYQLAICTMVKSADSFIPEWLDFHRFVGVEHVFIYDNENEGDTKLPTTVKDYVDKGFVTIVPWAHSVSRYKTYLEVQIAHENDCIWRHKYDVDWMIKIDVDEYIQPMDAQRPRITDYLQDELLKSLGALRVQNWFFGHPRHITPRGNSTITRNLWRSEKPTHQNTGHDKNILRPINVHYFKIHNVKLGGDIMSADPYKELRMVHFRVDNPRALRFELPDFNVRDKSMLRLRDLVRASKSRSP
ncbi:uncharacterized protein LOC110984988 [Acanthaster planci]|uniref:Glycosyltransferase family 92 protein n=1 Tax=Acanthaster planci TaxID=133434 RepID=A0A8B7Z6T5_ACAPL|nr:uncharacterized protein LOC110984988 [Acanthaster planci]